MARIRQIELSDEQDAFIEAGVEAGRYPNVDAVVDEALRLLRARQGEDAAKLEALRAAIQLGEDAVARGEYRDIALDDLDEFLEGLARGQRPASAA